MSSRFSLKSNSNMTVENYCVKSWNSNTRHIIRAFHQSRIIQVTDKSIDWQREFQRQREKQLAEKRRGNWEKLSATQKGEATISSIHIQYCISLYYFLDLHSLHYFLFHID